MRKFLIFVYHTESAIFSEALTSNL